MKRKLSELSEGEQKELLRAINRVLFNDFSISPESIDRFWEIFRIGSKLKYNT